MCSSDLVQLYTLLGESAAAATAGAAAQRLAGERATGELQEKSVAIRAAGSN